MNRKWTEQEIWSWFREHEWISGFNFVPSTPAGGVYALLQEYDHKNAFQEAAKEISLAASLGLNSVRLFLPFELWRIVHLVIIIDQKNQVNNSTYFWERVNVLNSNIY